MNSHTQQDVSSRGVGFSGLLTITFITLRLLGVINWSWWWVLAPIWIPACLGFVVVAIFLLLLAFGAVKTSKKNWF
jgi:hypothetical protein